MLDSIFEWIRLNKEWFLSGIGVFSLTFFVGTIRFFTKRQEKIEHNFNFSIDDNQKNKSLNDEKSTFVNNKEYIEYEDIDELLDVNIDDHSKVKRFFGGRSPYGKLKIFFSKIAMGSMNQSGWNRADIAILLMAEIPSHTPLVFYDYNSLSIPLKNKYIIVLSKKEDEVTIENIYRIQVAPEVARLWSEACGYYFDIKNSSSWRIPYNIRSLENLLSDKTEKLFLSLIERIDRYLEAIEPKKDFEILAHAQLDTSGNLLI